MGIEHTFRGPRGSHVIILGPQRLYKLLRTIACSKKNALCLDPGRASLLEMACPQCRRRFCLYRIVGKYLNT